MSSVIVFLSKLILLIFLTFLLQSLPVVSTVLIFWIYFNLMTLVFALQWLLFTVKFWSCCLCFHRLPSKSKGIFLFIVSFLFSCWLGWFLWYLRDVSRKNVFKIKASAAASGFCGWAHAGIDVYTFQHNISSSLIRLHGSGCFYCCHNS